MNAILFATLAMIWGGSFVAIERVLRVYPPLFAASMRCLVAVLFLMTYFKIKGLPTRLRPEHRKRSWLAGLFAQGIPFAFLFLAEKQVSPALAGIFNGTVPIWTYLIGTWGLLGRFSKRDVPTLAKTVGVSLGMAGIVIIFLPRLTSSPELAKSDALGVLGVFMMAVCYAIGVHLNRRVLEKGADPYLNVLEQSGVSAVLLIVLSLIKEGLTGEWRMIYEAGFRPEAFLAILYLGVLGTAIGFMVFFVLLKSWGTLRTAAITYMIPPLSIFFDWRLNGRTLSQFEWAGAFVIFLAVLLVQLAPQMGTQPKLQAEPKR